MSMYTNYSSLIKFFIIYLSFATCFSLFDKEHVIIKNRLPGLDPPLILRCRSKDDDLGIHTLHLFKTYEWSFRMNTFKTTLFYCDFVRGKQHASFVVFNADIDSKLRGHKFVYEVRAGGFYFNLNGVWQKVSGWIF